MRNVGKEFCLLNRLLEIEIQELSIHFYRYSFTLFGYLGAVHTQDSM